MSRIATPASIEAAPIPAKPLLEAVKKQLGSVPNLFRVVANSPAALEGYLGLNTALSKGSLDAKTRERIAIAVAEVNGCGYCLSAHTYIGKTIAKAHKAGLEVYIFYDVLSLAAAAVQREAAARICSVER